MAVQDLVCEDRLEPLMQEHGRDQVRMELIAFWSRHPNKRFAAGAISCALDRRKRQTVKALRALVEAGLVDICMDREEPFYSLTSDSSLREPVLELASLNGGDFWRLMAMSLQKRGKAVV
jgi:DNA-binding transcriptional ArsR family regulator